MADCNSWFDCGDEKKQNLGWFQILKLLITKDSNGCPTLRTTGSGGSGSGGAVTLPSTTRSATRTIISAAGAGSVPAGARSITIELSSDFTGTIDGDTTSAGGMLTPGASYNWAISQNDDKLGAIGFNITTGKIAIQKVV